MDIPYCIQTIPIQNYLIHPNRDEEQNHPCIGVRVDKDGNLETSRDVTNILGGKLITDMKKNVVYNLWINVKNQQYNRIIHNMTREGIIDSYQCDNKWCFAAETSDEVYRRKLLSAIDNTSPYFEWYVKRPRIN